MLTEKDLLLDIISNVPNNSKWYISKNSWDKIPFILKNFDFNDEIDECVFEIEKDKLTILLNIVENEELYNKIIRQFITDKRGKIIMESFDVMAITILGDSFPSKDILIDKYFDTDVSVE